MLTVKLTELQQRDINPLLCALSALTAPLSLAFLPLLAAVLSFKRNSAAHELFALVFALGRSTP